ncbi:hypothetical protein SETIT_5G044500v2 [Setaria italica]|uniref:Flavin-containing monooxygenase n=1 Tax=Setaria italica TaxID=4555 RepID=A0A368R148_SETIT|nr:hypothetical protein SETIT_5G044500v2 [Setaria italica]
MAAAVVEEDVIIVGVAYEALSWSATTAWVAVAEPRKRTYDRLHIYLAKQYIYMLGGSAQGADVPCDVDVAVRRGVARRSIGARGNYLRISQIAIPTRTRLRREVRSRGFDGEKGRWEVEAVDLATGRRELYVARFLVVASGENDERFVPEVPGLEAFPGRVVHAAEYRSGEGMRGKAVLVVGCGNSGMEIAYDLAAAGAVTSIAVRSELHLVTKEIWNVAMSLYGYHVPAWIIDKLVLLMCAVVFGDTARHGLRRPAMGPFTMKFTTPAYPVFDRPRQRRQVLGDGRRHPFDAIVLATGYRSTVRRWLRHWKGEKGLYCAGLMPRGIYGSYEDAELIAGDISEVLRHQQAQGNGTNK